MRRKVLFGMALTALVIAAGGATAYVRWVGYPQVVSGRWVRPRIMIWYWTGMPGWPYPGIVQYGYPLSGDNLLRTAHTFAVFGRTLIRVTVQ
ncbi:MAG TPA: hypothetical protein VFO39_16140 [Candidatus Sulfotelmatobacter sp.]|nr:hypothetical protein [Candidatus Sulfotelmatobacter sp.]